MGTDGKKKRASSLRSFAPSRSLDRLCGLLSARNGRSVQWPAMRCLIICGVVLMGAQRLWAADAAPGTLRVMSFNIRNSSAKDGENAWEKRKGFLLETVRAFGPDLLGMQEVLEDQAEFLRGGLADYGFVGT